MNSREKLKLICLSVEEFWRYVCNWTYGRRFSAVWSGWIPCLWQILWVVVAIDKLPDLHMGMWHAISTHTRASHEYNRTAPGWILWMPTSLRFFKLVRKIKSNIFPSTSTLIYRYPLICLRERLHVAIPQPCDTCPVCIFISLKGFARRQFRCTTGNNAK